VGPSSGFSVEELKYLADNGFLPVGLASSRLRTETAAVALAAIWAAQGVHARPDA
jgi:RsmE family RNA methyltransferase